MVRCMAHGPGSAHIVKDAWIWSPPTYVHALHRGMSGFPDAPNRVGGAGRFKVFNYFKCVISINMFSFGDARTQVRSESTGRGGGMGTGRECSFSRQLCEDRQRASVSEMIVKSDCTCSQSQANCAVREPRGSRAA